MIFDLCQQKRRRDSAAKTKKRNYLAMDVYRDVWKRQPLQTERLLRRRSGSGAVCLSWPCKLQTGWASLLLPGTLADSRHWTHQSLPAALHSGYTSCLQAASVEVSKTSNISREICPCRSFGTAASSNMTVIRHSCTAATSLCNFQTQALGLEAEGPELESSSFLQPRRPCLLGLKKQVPCYKADLTSVFRRMVLPHRTVLCICSQASAIDGHSGSQLSKGCS